MKMYLAGGFKSGWQDDVKDAILLMRDDAEFFDPRDQLMHDPKHYTAKDLAMIVECDLVFAYMEADNPGMANMAFEIGFAHAIGRKVILINEKGQRWAEMMHQVSDVYSDVEGALAALPFMEEFLA